MWKARGGGAALRIAVWICGLASAWWPTRASWAQAADTPPSSPALSVPASATALGLAALLQHAEQHAPQLLAARARLGLGPAAMDAARPALREQPELELGVGPRTTVGAEPVLD